MDDLKLLHEKKALNNGMSKRDSQQPSLSHVNMSCVDL